jgi:hypothetical protein
MITPASQHRLKVCPRFYQTLLPDRTFELLALADREISLWSQKMPVTISKPRIDLRRGNGRHGQAPRGTPCRYKSYGKNSSLVFVVGWTISLHTPVSGCLYHPTPQC